VWRRTYRVAFYNSHSAAAEDQSLNQDQESYGAACGGRYKYPPCGNLRGWNSMRTRDDHAFDGEACSLSGGVVGSLRALKRGRQETTFGFIFLNGVTTSFEFYFGEDF